MTAADGDVIRVGVVGASGRMGRLVVAEILADPSLCLVAAIGGRARGADAGVLAGVEACGVIVRAPSDAALVDVDVVVDFSTPEVLGQVLPFLGTAALVSGTTGLPAAIVDGLAEQSGRAPVLHAANFSTGVAVLLHLAAEAARALSAYDVEIIEAHHNRKADAPSGTALALGQAVAEARHVQLSEAARHGREGRELRTAGEIGFHAIRAGDVVGEHTVWLAGPGERVTLGHVATSRQTFASGAVRAARWLTGRPAGRYTLRQVLSL